MNIVTLKLGLDKGDAAKIQFGWKFFFQMDKLLHIWAQFSLEILTTAVMSVFSLSPSLMLSEFKAQFLLENILLGIN